MKNYEVISVTETLSLSGHYCYKPVGRAALTSPDVITCTISVSGGTFSDYEIWPHV
jgi:hypothetical protein